MTRTIRSIAVFCGSNAGRGETYRAAARELGREIGRRGLTLVYGGSNMGLMGILADAVLTEGGSVHGVITQRLADRGHLHERLSRHEIVATMGLRKARMGEQADAFIALPGGIGTLEEFMRSGRSTSSATSISRPASSTWAATTSRSSASSST